MAIDCEIAPCPEPSRLEPVWRELEARAEPSFFLSWAWIGTVVATKAPPQSLLTVRRAGRVVGLALLGRRKGRRFDRLRTPSLHLNETGDPVRDAVMCEYNGVLAEAGAEAEVVAAALAALVGLDWRELYLSGIAPELAELCRRRGLGLRILRAHLAPLADFATMAAGDPLESLSRNSRQQIRRSLKLYAMRGEPVLERAADAAEALAWFDDLAAAHTVAWRRRGRPGAFADPGFVAFHRRLIDASFADGIVDLLRVRAGSSEIGHLYNFRYRGWGYSYQSGFAFEEDDRYKPGLVCHLLALRHYRAEGMAGYRFLAGDSRYKNSLATGKDELLWLAVHRADPLHRLEDLARRLRERMGR